MLRFVSLCVLSLLALACSVENPAIVFVGGNPGDACPCADELVCMDGVCYAMRGEGALCSDQSPPCVNPLVCLNGRCTKPGGPDGDPEPDPDSGHESACLGVCNQAADTTRCVDDDANLCVCVSGDWTFVSCSTYCAKRGKTPKGCGLVQELGMDYCRCEETTVPDGDPEPPLTCAGSCSGSPFTNHCVDNDDNLCICLNNAWMRVDCQASCASRGLESMGCELAFGQNYPDCQCRAIPDGDPDLPGDCQGPCDQYGPEQTHCTANSDVCICLNYSWSKRDCRSTCAGRGQEFVGCAYSPAEGYPDCVCRELVDGDSDPGCVSDDPAVGRIGQACPLPITATLTMNDRCGQCSNGLVCMGLYLDGQRSQESAACTEDADCKAVLGSLGVCAGGYCGLSFCNEQSACTSDAQCAAVGEGACCYVDSSAFAAQCLPSEFCTISTTDKQLPGQPCAFLDDLNKDYGGCKENNLCLGAVYDGKADGSITIPCKTAADCAQYGLNSDLVGCTKSGYCGLSFCSVDAGGACTATAQNPHGTSPVCDAQPHMNSERWGRACCTLISGQKVCLADSVCTQEGGAAAGEACKDPTTQINMDRDFCKPSLSCVAFPAVNTHCASRADCQSLGGRISDCVNGNCAISFCTMLSCNNPLQCPAESYGAGSCCTSEIFSDGTSLCAPSILCEP